MISEHLFRERKTENVSGNKMTPTPKAIKAAPGQSAILKVTNLNKLPGQKDPVKAAKDIRQQMEDLTNYCAKVAEVIDAIEEHLPESEVRLHMQHSNKIKKLDQFREKFIRILNDRNPNLPKRGLRLSESGPAIDRAEEVDTPAEELDEGLPTNEPAPVVRSFTLELSDFAVTADVAEAPVEVPEKIATEVMPLESVSVQAKLDEVINPIPHSDISVQAHEVVELRNTGVEAMERESEDEDVECEFDETEEEINQESEYQVVHNEMFKYIRRLRISNRILMFFLLLIIATPLFMFDE